MSWKFSEGIPIYSQIVEQIKLMIISEVFKPGDKFPSVRDLAAQAGVNPNTMQRALQELEREELIFSQRTSGRFITEDVEMIKKLKEEVATGFADEFLKKMLSLGFNKEQVVQFIKNYKEGEGKDE